MGQCFYDYIEKLNSIKQTIVCGDFNLIARKEDSHSQVQSSLQEHVALMSRERSFFFHATDSAFVDAYRFRHPAKERCGYTWWSNRINYREENKGARLDYFLVPQKMEKNIVDCMNLFHVYGSDHCPLRLTTNLPVKRYASMHIEGVMRSLEACGKGRIISSDPILNPKIGDTSDALGLKKNDYLIVIAKVPDC